MVKKSAELNVWPFTYRIQFARAHLKHAALSWYSGRSFQDWLDFE